MEHDAAKLKNILDNHTILEAYSDAIKLCEKQLDHISQSRRVPTGDVDILIAGFPCKDLSLLRNGAGDDDNCAFNCRQGKTGGPAFGIRKYVFKHNIPIVILENVSGMLRRFTNLKGQRPIDVQNRIFHQHHYSGAYILADAKHYGLAQSRPRAWMLYVLDGHGDASQFPDIMQQLRLKPSSLKHVVHTSGIADMVDGRKKMKLAPHSFSLDGPAAWQRDMKALCKEFDYDCQDLLDKAKSVAKTCRAAMNDRELFTASFLLLRLENEYDSTPTNFPEMVLQVDQSPRRVLANNLHFLLHRLGCVTPKGKYFVPSRGAFITSDELAKAQGMSSNDVTALFGSNRLNQRFVQDCVGNGFATTVCVAALFSAFCSWDRH